MKIRILKQGVTPIYEGDYQYLEGGRTNGQPSFHIATEKDDEYYEIYFYCENEEEIEDLINTLKEIQQQKD